jgi:hypothetical protein
MHKDVRTCSLGWRRGDLPRIRIGIGHSIEGRASKKGIVGLNSSPGDSKILRNCSDKTPPKKIFSISRHVRRHNVSTIHKKLSARIPIGSSIAGGRRPAFREQSVCSFRAGKESCRCLSIPPLQ